MQGLAPLKGFYRDVFMVLTKVKGWETANGWRKPKFVWPRVRWKLEISDFGTEMVVIEGAYRACQGRCLRFIKPGKRLVNFASLVFVSGSVNIRSSGGAWRSGRKPAIFGLPGRILQRTGFSSKGKRTENFRNPVASERAPAAFGKSA